MITEPTPPPGTEVPEIADAAEDDRPGGIMQPDKLIRIASMTQAMLEEVRSAPLDESGRRLLAGVLDRSVDELCDVLPAELREELGDMFIGLDGGDDPPTEPVLRIAQAQLIGWLQGLFNGIQAAVMSQQVAAQQQFREMQRRRALDRQASPPGQYL